MFVVTRDGAVMADESVCLDAPGHNDDSTRRPKARLSMCADTPRQRWRYDTQDFSGEFPFLRRNPVNKESKNTCPGNSVAERGNGNIN
ncbi:Polypeptide n-acetylgalactosaminyltransferase 3-like protein [Gryllus bimaculatus]|nr:Polypeptide n-acetylgalactosaminyltransferase 3-like protein [Gryllus bimaculatus]